MTQFSDFMCHGNAFGPWENGGFTNCFIDM